MIIRDDLNMDANTIQQFTYLVCFNNIRTRQVISTPTPVRYADLCAFRSKIHLEAQLELSNLGLDGSGDQRTQAKEEDVDNDIQRLNHLLKTHENLKNIHYYC